MGVKENPGERFELMSRFREMYRSKRFEHEEFDLSRGYLQTTLSDKDRMPLEFFVEYNNNWWFAIVTGVEVPSIAYDPESDSGMIVLEIAYGNDILRAAQHVRFGDRTIDWIRTYASPAFFTRPNPLVELDAHGNAIWLETGYDLANSTTAALGFLETPRGRSFAEHEVTGPAVQRIRSNLADLAARLSGSDK
jgi:hypothetical protein